MEPFDSELGAEDGSNRPGLKLRRVIYQTVACRDANACVAAIQGRIEHDWHVSAVQTGPNGGFVVRFRRDEAITPYGPTLG